MLLAKNLAELRKFNDTDMKIISDFTELVCNSCNLSDEEKDWNTFSRKIADIILFSKRRLSSMILDQIFNFTKTLIEKTNC